MNSATEGSVHTHTALHCTELVILTAVVTNAATVCYDWAYQSKALINVW